MRETKKAASAAAVTPSERGQETQMPKYDYQRPRFGSEGQPYEAPDDRVGKRHKEVDPIIRNMLLA